MKKILPILFISVALAGCSARAVLVQKKTLYDPTEDARIRIFQKNGNKTIKVINATSCKEIEDNGETIRSRNPFARENSYNGLPRRTLKSISIGMPLTQRSYDAINRDSYLDTDSFTEHRLTANQPVVISGASWFSTSGATMETSVSCEVNGEFIPEAGVDYELDYRFLGSNCMIQVYKLEPLDTPEGKVTAKSGKAVPLKKCD